MLLGSSYAEVQLAGADVAGVDEDDDWEYFVAAWCVDPGLIPDEKIVVIPEPKEPGILFLREEEIIHSSLPTLRYLARPGLGRAVLLLGR